MGFPPTYYDAPVNNLQEFFGNHFFADCLIFMENICPRVLYISVKCVIDLILWVNGKAVSWLMATFLDSFRAPLPKQKKLPKPRLKALCRSVLSRRNEPPMNQFKRPERDQERGITRLLAGLSSSKEAQEAKNEQTTIRLQLWKKIKKPFYLKKINILSMILIKGQ